MWRNVKKFRKKIFGLARVKYFVYLKVVSNVEQNHVLDNEGKEEHIKF